jgi:spore germination protein GerM
LLSALAVLSALVGGCGGDASAPGRAGESADESAPGASASGEDDAEPTEPGTSLEPLPRRTVEIYFPSMIENGLVSESREIFDTATPGDQVKQIVNDLLSGPTSEDAGRAVPGGTRLRQVYVLDDGVAWLDFTSELADGLGGGSMSELLTVYSIVDSVVANVSQVRRVGILVDGQPVETLNGHLHLIKPLRPDFSLVRGSITVEGPGPDDPDRLTEAAAPGAAAD